MTPDYEPSPQQQLEILRERRRKAGEQMENSPLSGDQGGFFDLFVEAELLDSTIKELLDSIKPVGPSGPISESAIQTSRGPDRRIITRKK